MNKFIIAALFACVAIASATPIDDEEFDVQLKSCFQMLEDKLSHLRHADVSIESLVARGNANKENPLTGEALDGLKRDCSHYMSDYFWHVDNTNQACRKEYYSRINPSQEFFTKHIEPNFPHIAKETRVISACDGVFQSQ